jgi:CubicO group peptidase (beta-lactamase class C family)
MRRLHDRRPGSRGATRSATYCAFALFLVAALGASGCRHRRSRRAAPSASAAAAAAQSGLEALLTAAETRGFNGAVFVSSHGRTLVDRAYGWADAAKSRRADRATLFNVASVSKAITATAVLTLVGDGRLRREAPLSSLLPQVPKDKADITIDQLLTHTSGIPHGYAANGVRDRSAAIAAVLSAPLAHPPGAKFEYSDDNYVLLAAIVETVTNETFAHYTRRAVFEPAGMKTSRFWEEVDQTAGGDVAAILPKALDESLRGLNWGYIGSGGIWSTADELVSLLRALRDGKVLRPELADELFAPRVKVSVGSAGYGWFSGKSSGGASYVFTRGNEDWGHNAFLAFYPDRDAIVCVVSNSGDWDEQPVSRVVAGELETRLPE